MLFAYHNYVNGAVSNQLKQTLNGGTCVLGLEASLLKEDRARIFKRLWSPGIDFKE